MITGITIGADCEVFAKHKKSGEIVSAENLILGTKDKPYVFDATNKYFATSLDNILAEFCIPPATSKEMFYQYLRKSLGYVNKKLGKDHCVAIEQAISMDPVWLQTDQAKLFGCEPDYDAYSGRENLKPACDDINLRSAGGHVHIGYQTPRYPYLENEYKGKYAKQYFGDPERCNIIRAMDLFVGVPSVVMEPDNKRKQLYGKAGCFRPKEYGVEYRTISNYYLKDRKLIYWLYDQTMAAIDWVNAGNTVQDSLGYYIQRAINNASKSDANEIINEFKLKTA
jgi:hypothetical protein